MCGCAFLRNAWEHGRYWRSCSCFFSSLRSSLPSIHKNYEQPEKAENGGGDAEDAAGQADNEHEKPCDDGQRRKDGRKEDFQKETHINIPPVLFVSAFSIQEAALPCKDAGPQKKAGAAYLAASRPAWDKYPIILWWQAGKGYRLPPAISAPDSGVYPPCPRRKRALFHMF